MRLYEFTNPNHYLLPETDAEDLSNNIKTTDKTDIADRHLKKKPEIKKPTDWTPTSAATRPMVLPEEPCPQPL